MKLACGAPNQKGSAPNAQKNTQMPVASRKLCCRVSPRDFELMHASAISVPTRTVTIAVMAKARAFGRADSKPAAIGSTIDAPSAATSQPIT